MRLNLENDYAYRIVLKFSKSPLGTKYRSQDLSEALKIPERFTYRILRKLMTYGLINSIRGPFGGYVLAKKPENITLYDVYKAISGDIVINMCLRDGYCDAVEGDCEVHATLMGIQKDIIHSFESVNFKDIVSRNK